jgi:hypothetical protein
MDTQLSRRISGMIFLSANAFLLITNFQNTNTLQFCASILFLSCSVALILSANNHRWLFWGGFAVAIAYIMTALSNEGSGDILAHISIIFGVFAGALIFRGGLQRETGKQIELMKPFDILDKYPLAMAGFIEGACCVLLFISSILLSDMRLFLASGLWTIAHGFLIYSDEYLREKLGI